MGDFEDIAIDEDGVGILLGSRLRVLKTVRRDTLRCRGFS